MAEKKELTYWDTINKNYRSYPKLSTNITCDVAIIGGGIEGCASAYYLSKYKLKTTILEKDSICCGKSHKSTGLLNPSEVCNLEKNDNIRLFKLCEKYLDEIESITSSIDKPCDFQRNNCIYLGNEPSFLSYIKKGHLNSGMVKESLNINDEGAVVLDNFGEISPIKFCYALAKACNDKYCTIYENTPVCGFSSSSSGIEVFTKDNTIFCKSLVITAEAYLQQLYNFKSLVKLYNYTIVTQPQDKLHLKNNFIIKYFDNFSISIRSVGENRILASISTPDEELYKTKDETLKKVLSSLFNDFINFNIDYSWETCCNSSKDNFPIISEVPNYPNCYFNIAPFNNKEIFSLIGSEIVKDLILYDNNPDASIFSLKTKKYIH